MTEQISGPWLTVKWPDRPDAPAVTIHPLTEWSQVEALAAAIRDDMRASAVWWVTPPDPEGV